MRSILFILFLTLWHTALHSGETPTPLLEKKVDVDLWGMDLSEVVSQLTERTGIDVRVSPTLIRPREFSRHRFYIQGRGAPVRLVFEWIARSLRCRYRMDTPGSVWFSGSYDWLAKEDQSVMIESISPIVSPDTDINGLKKLLLELSKAASLFPHYSLRIEEEDQKVVAILPSRIKVLLKKALYAMAEPGIAIDGKGSRAFTRDETDMLTVLRKKVVVQYDGWTLKDAVADLQLQANVLIAVDPRLVSNQSLPPLTLDLGADTTLRQAIEAIAKAWKIKGYELYAPNGIFLGNGGQQWAFGGSRAFLWEDLDVKSYAIASLADASSGEAVAHHIRRQVSPDTWQDPCTAVAFHPDSKQLIVMAPADIQERVLAHLRQLHRSIKARRTTAKGSATHD